MILIVDNGLFANSISMYLHKLNKITKVIKSNEINLDLIENYPIQAIIVSNGIEKKDSINNSIRLVQRYAWRVPILGIGIGAIAIGVLFNAKICDSKIDNIEVFTINHDMRTIFFNLEVFSCSKWCKYTINEEMFKKTDLEVSATSNKEIIAFRHKNLAIEGILSDITSITCKYGEVIFNNFLNYYLK